MTEDDYEARVVATFPDGSVIQRYVNGGQYWQVKLGATMYPGQRLSMKRAAMRTAYSGGEVVPGVAAAWPFYAAVRKYEAERAAEIAARSERD